MQKRYLFWLLIVVGVLVAGVLLVFHRQPEPEFEGKRLSEWVELTVWPPSSRVTAVGGVSRRVLEYGRVPDDVTDAIHHMGSNGVPFLVNWIRYQPPSWKTEVFRFINKTFHSSLIDHRALRAAGA